MRITDYYQFQDYLNLLKAQQATTRSTDFPMINAIIQLQDQITNLELKIKELFNEKT